MNEYEVFIEDINSCGGAQYAKKELVEIEATMETILEITLSSTAMIPVELSSLSIFSPPSSNIIAHKYSQ